MSERSNVLVTGGSGKLIINTNIKMIHIYKYKIYKGYIGSHVVLQLLLSKRYNVAVIDNSANSHPESIKRVEEIASGETGEQAKVQLFQGDLRKREDVEKVFKYFETDGNKKGMNGVIHIAVCLFFFLIIERFCKLTDYFNYRH